MIVALSF
jgi:hypothetical protein